MNFYTHNISKSPVGWFSAHYEWTGYNLIYKYILKILKMQLAFITDSGGLTCYFK